MTPLMFMVAAAKAKSENLTPASLVGELAHPDVLLVDVREPSETENGVIPGAMLVPRGMLEFRADHGTPFHIEGFELRRRVIVYSAAGYRSALAVRSLQELGYHDVAHLGGGLKAWVYEGRPVTVPDPTRLVWLSPTLPRAPQDLGATQARDPQHPR
jgi:rhodanese-related sulfurtransferase